MKKYILFFSAIISIFLSTFFSLMPLAGVSQVDISNLYPTIITPTSLTFSIWSLIYLSWIVLGIYTIFFHKHLSFREVTIFASTQILSSLWLIPWHYNDMKVSFGIMGILFLILGYLSISSKEHSLYQSCVYLFFSWIVIAAMANSHILLVYLDLYTNPEIFGVTSLFVATCIGYFFYDRYNTIIPSLVFIWSLMGIGVYQINEYIIITSICGVIFLLSTVIIYFAHLEERKTIK